MKQLLSSIREGQRGNPMPKNDHIGVNVHWVVGFQIEQRDPPGMTEAVLRGRVCGRRVREVALDLLDPVA